MEFFGRESELNELLSLWGKRDGKSIRTALVYDGALAPIVEIDGHFDAQIPVRSLLGV